MYACIHFLRLRAGGGGQCPAAIRQGSSPAAGPPLPRWATTGSTGAPSTGSPRPRPRPRPPPTPRRHGGGRRRRRRRGGLPPASAGRGGSRCTPTRTPARPGGEEVPGGRGRAGGSLDGPSQESACAGRRNGGGCGGMRRPATDRGPKEA